MIDRTLRELGELYRSRRELGEALVPGGRRNGAGSIHVEGAGRAGSIALIDHTRREPGELDRSRRELGELHGRGERARGGTERSIGGDRGQSDRSEGLFFKFLNCQG